MSQDHSPSLPPTFPPAEFPPGPFDRFYPPDVPRDVEVPDRSAWAAFEENAARCPDAPAISFLGRTWSWAQAHDEALALAGALQKLGVGRGDRVLLFMQNCPQFVIAFHAVLRADAVVVPANPMYQAAELAHYIADSGCRVAVATCDIASSLVEAAVLAPGGLDHLVVFDLAEALPTDGSELEAQKSTWPVAWQSWLPRTHARPRLAAGRVHEWRDLIREGSRPVGPTAATGEDIALIAYTSGTTGIAKGCVHLHRSLVHQQICTNYWTDMREGDVTLVVVPMFHITGLVMGMLAAVQRANTVVILPRWDREVAALTIERERVTHWPNIPTMVLDLLAWPGLGAADLSTLRFIGGGGVTMQVRVAERLHREFGLEYLEGYGLTESCAAALQNPRGGRRTGTLGIPFMGVDVQVFDPDFGHPVATGTVGEIVLRSQALFAGYWNRPQQSADAFLEWQGERYFRTGDLGSVDDDGYFRLSDRLKRMINAAGFKIWPAEVESLMYTHPAVHEVCVIRIPDRHRSEAPKALVVLKTEYAESVTAEDLVAWARSAMAAYKYPRIIEIVDSLPHNAAGKLMWRELQEAEDARARPEQR